MEKLRCRYDTAGTSTQFYDTSKMMCMSRLVGYGGDLQASLRPINVNVSPDNKDDGQRKKIEKSCLKMCF